MTVIVRTGVIDRCDCESKLIGGICRSVPVIKDKFRSIEDINTRPVDPRLSVESIRGLYDGNHLYAMFGRIGKTNVRRATVRTNQ